MLVAQKRQVHHFFIRALTTAIPIPFRASVASAILYFGIYTMLCPEVTEEASYRTI